MQFRLPILTLVTYAISSINTLEHDRWINMKLEHCLTPKLDHVFTERGNISVPSLRLGQSVISQNPLTDEEVKNLVTMAANNELYHLKSTVVSNDGTVRTFLSTIKACMLLEAELDDRLSVSLDYLGRVIGVTLLIASKSTCEGAIVNPDKFQDFTTSVYIRHSETGALPDTLSFIQKIEREREAKEKGEVADNRSILAKYWMYIVPVVILVMVSSITNPEAAAGGGSR